MSAEESKSDSDYVHMGDGAGAKPGTTKGLPAGLDDPNLSQEDRDHRLAIALQQQENAAVYDAHKKKHAAAVKANTNRTTRSNTHTRLAAVRAKDHGKMRTPNYAEEGEYTAPKDDINMSNLKGALPQEIADHKLAAEIQKQEQQGAGTAREMTKIIKEEEQDDEAQALRNARSKARGRGFQ